MENSLWQGVPNYLRELNEQLEENLGYKLPVEFVPVRFTSWMGGDRDGNPNVTADITRHVLLLQPLESHRFVPERYSGAGF